MNQKKLLLLALLLTVSSLVFAQGIVAKGFKGGLNIANYTGADVSEYTKSRYGFAAGAFLTYKLNSNLSLQPEIYYTTKGVEVNQDDDDIYFHNDVILSYIELPLLLKMNFNNSSDLTPFIFLGPAIAFNVGGTYDVTIEGDYFDDYEDSGDLKDISPIDFSLVFGGGIDTEKVTFDIRYDFGLSKVDGGLTDDDLYNSVISFMVGVKI